MYGIPSCRCLGEDPDGSPGIEPNLTENFQIQKKFENLKKIQSIH